VGAVGLVATAHGASRESLVGTAGAAGVYLCGLRLPLPARLPLVSRLLAASRAALHPDSRYHWGVRCHLYPGGVQHCDDSVCPTSCTAGARCTADNGRRVGRSAPPARWLWSLAYAPGHHRHAAGGAL